MLTKHIRRVLLALLLLALEPAAYCQFLTFDAINNVIQQALQALQNPSFKSLVKGVEDLSKITGAVRQFHRGTEAITSISRCTQKLSAISQLARTDGHISTADYSRIAVVLADFQKEATSIMKDARSGLSSSMGEVMKMDDGSRMQWLDQVATKTKAMEVKLDGLLALMNQVSYRRSFNRADQDATARLYGVVIARVNRTRSGSGDGYTTGISGDDVYANANYDPSSSLTDYNNSADAKANREIMQRYQTDMQNYQDHLEIYNARKEREAGGIFARTWQLKIDDDKTIYWHNPATGEDCKSESEVGAAIRIIAREIALNDPAKPRPPAQPQIKTGG